MPARRRRPTPAISSANCTPPSNASTHVRRAVGIRGVERRRWRPALRPARASPGSCRRRRSVPLRRRSLRARALRPTPPSPTTATAEPAATLRRVDHRTDTGDDRAAEDRGHLGRDVGIDADDRGRAPPPRARRTPRSRCSGAAAARRPRAAGSRSAASRPCAPPTTTDTGWAGPRRRSRTAPQLATNTITTWSPDGRAPSTPSPVPPPRRPPRARSTAGIGARPISGDRRQVGVAQPGRRRCARAARRDRDRRDRRPRPRAGRCRRAGDPAPTGPRPRIFMPAPQPSASPVDVEAGHGAAEVRAGRRVARRAPAGRGPGRRGRGLSASSSTRRNAST